MYNEIKKAMMPNLFKRILKLICLSPLIIVFDSAKAQVYGRNGMVVSDSKIASEIGIQMLKAGGNAIDASIATAFALAVTHPQAGNIGGGGFLVYRSAQGVTKTIDFREKAPLAATSDMFQDADGNLISGANHEGLKSVGVPGTVAGLYLAYEKYGLLPWRKLIQPAIDLAENGFEMTWHLYDWARKIEKWDPSKDIMVNYFRDETGEIIQPGQTWRQPALANTLKLIRDHGHDGFYKGAVAKEIATYMKKNGGIITKEDLAKYRAIEREPLKGTYKNFQIHTMPPPSSGGVALIEMMNLMELADLDAMEFNSTEYVHLIAEVMRRTFADRAEHLGDPDFNLNMPLGKLMSKEFAKKRFENIDMKKASVSDSSKFGQIYDGTSTTHFSVVDEKGGAVSLTYTLEHSYGSGMGSSKLGFIFNNEMGDFNPVEGLTTGTGLIGTRPNIIEPEKRMLSSMTPAIITRNGKPFLIIGSPGGRTIINTVFQAVLSVLAYKMPIEKSIEAMKIHQPWFPNKIFYEENLLSPDTRDALIGLGHTLAPVNNLGRLMGIKYDEKNQRYAGASDSSSPDGGAVGYTRITNPR